MKNSTGVKTAEQEKKKFGNTEGERKKKRGEGKEKADDKPEKKKGRIKTMISNLKERIHKSNKI